MLLKQIYYDIAKHILTINDDVCGH